MVQGEPGYRGNVESVALRDGRRPEQLLAHHARGRSENAEWRASSVAPCYAPPISAPATARFATGNEQGTPSLTGKPARTTARSGKALRPTVTMVRRLPCRDQRIFPS